MKLWVWYPPPEKPICKDYKNGGRIELIDEWETGFMAKFWLDKVNLTETQEANLFLKVYGCSGGIIRAWNAEAQVENRQTVFKGVTKEFGFIAVKSTCKKAPVFRTKVTVCEVGDTVVKVIEASEMSVETDTDELGDESVSMNSEILKTSSPISTTPSTSTTAVKIATTKKVVKSIEKSTEKPEILTSPSPTISLVENNDQSKSCLFPPKTLKFTRRSVWPRGKGTWSVSAKLDLPGIINLKTWAIRIKFSQPVSEIAIWAAVAIKQSDTVWRILPNEYGLTKSPIQLTFNGVTPSENKSLDAEAVLCEEVTDDKFFGEEAGGSEGLLICGENSSEGPHCAVEKSVDVSTIKTATEKPVIKAKSLAGLLASAKNLDNDPKTESSSKTDATSEAASNALPTPAKNITWNPVPPNLPADRCSATFKPNMKSIAQTIPDSKKPEKSYKYDLYEVLHKSILFYESQRSGVIQSESNRIPWRLDSFVKDGCDAGTDLSRGWFDAGDYVKFNFPQAFSVTYLAWGMIEFEKGYLYR